LADAGVKMANPAPAAPATSGPPKFKRHLRNYLLDKSLQLRYVLFVSILSALLTGGLGYFVWYQANYATKKIGESMKDFGDPALTDWVMSNLQRDDQGLVFVMALAGLGLIAVLSLYLIIMTHKVAGPLYKMGLYFDKIRDGRLPQVYDLRRGDQLRDVFSHFQDMVVAIRKRSQRDVETYDAFLGACEASGVSSAGELGHKLDELRALKKSRESAIE
jgi:hypothetical protein